MAGLPLNVILLSICLLMVFFVITIFFIKNTSLKLPFKEAKNNNLLQPMRNSMVDNSKLRTQLVLKNHFSDVPFDVAFLQNGLDEVIVRYSIEPVETLFHTLVPDVPTGVRIIKSITNKDNRLIFELSEEGKKLLQTGQAEISKTADGAKWLPYIRGVKDNKTIELFKAQNVSRLTDVAKNLLRIANIAVAAANIISNIDMAKKLDDLDNKVDFIIAGRHLDKKAELEKCYRLVSEIKLICDKGDWEQKLYDIHTKLTKLRCDWKLESEYKLKNIKNPYEKGLAKFLKAHTNFTRLLLRESKKDKIILDALNEINEILFLNDFAVLFDFALCSAINYPFSTKEDIRTIEYIVDEVRKKNQFISDRNKDVAIEKYLTYLIHCKKKYQCLSENESRVGLSD